PHVLVSGDAGGSGGDLGEIRAVGGPKEVEAVLDSIVARPGQIDLAGADYGEGQIAGRRRDGSWGDCPGHGGTGVVGRGRVTGGDRGRDVKVVDDAGRPAPPGVVGHPLARRGKPAPGSL